jgi:hypothetical protein
MLAQVIKNVNFPICKTCVYYRNKAGKCIKFGAMDVVSGLVNYQSAHTIRSANGPCEERGLYYKSLSNALVTKDSFEK